MVKHASLCPSLLNHQNIANGEGNECIPVDPCSFLILLCSGLGIGSTESTGTTPMGSTSESESESELDSEPGSKLGIRV